MKNFARALKSEFRRILSDKKLLLCTIGLLLLLIALLTVILATTSIGNPISYQPNTERFAREYDYYSGWYLYLTGASDVKPDSVLTTQDLAYLKERMEYFSFMLQNGGEWYKFIDLSAPQGTPIPEWNIYNVSPASRGAFAQLWIMRMSPYPLIAIAALIAIVICVLPYKSGVMKNYYASPIDKRTLFAGKLTACYILCAIFWLIAVVWGLCFGAVGEPVRILRYDGNVYYSFGLTSVFIVKMFGALLAMAITCSSIAIAGRYKNYIPTAAIIVIIVGLSVISEFLMTKGSMNSFAKCVIPVSALYINDCVPSDGALWALYAIYLIIAAALTAFCINTADKDYAAE